MAAPVGFATIFPGWNVWAVRQKDDLDFEGPLMIGVDRDRQLRIWVELTVEAAPGVAVRDSELDVSQLKGDEIQIIPDAGGLEEFETQAEQRPGANLMVDGPSTVRLVRFHNRGAASVIPWPASLPVFGTHNYLLETVYEPSSSNPITSGPAPDTLAGTLDEAGEAVGKAASSAGKILLWVGVAALGIVLISQLGKGSQ